MIYTAISPALRSQVEPIVPQENTPEQILNSIFQMKPEDFENFFTSILPDLIKSINFNNIPQLIQPFPDVVAHAAMSVPAYVKERTQLKPSDQISFFELTWRFILNLTDTFITALNFYDESDPPASIYEKQVLITIYYRLIQVPIGVCLLIQPLVVVAWKAYVIAMVVLAAAVGAIYVYNKYMRPFPSALPCCEMNKDLVKKLYKESIIGLEVETDSLISQLNRSDSKPIMVLGAAGSGKTTLMHKLQQRINEGKVPPKLRNKKIVTILGGVLMAKSNNGFGDKLKKIKQGLSGFTDQTIIHIDELHAVAKNPACFELMKEFIRTPGLQCVTSTTWEYFNSEICPLDVDHSFRRSFGANYISIDRWDSKTTQTVLQQMALGQPDVLFSENVFKQMVDLTDSSLHELPQPAKAIELMQNVIEQYRINCEVPESKEHREQKAALVQLEIKRKLNWPIEKAEDRLLRESIAESIAQMDRVCQHRVKEIQTFNSLMQLVDNIKKQTIENARTLQNQHDSQTEKRYLFNYFYLLPCLMKMVERQSEELKLKVDKEFVAEVFVNYKRKTESAHRNLKDYFHGLLNNPSPETIDEVRLALKSLSGVFPKGLGKPNFSDMLKERWDSHKIRLMALGFKDFEVYEAVICEACNQGTPF